MATVTGSDVARQLLADLGAPQTPGNIRAVSVWLAFENSVIAGNNPWNLHAGPACTAAAGYCPGQGSLPGQTGNRYAGPGDTNVAVFATLSDGIAANARNLQRPLYAPLVANLRANNPMGFLVALAASPWSASHYGGGSKLYNAFNGGFDYSNQLHTLSSGTGGGTGTTGGKGGPIPIGTTISFIPEPTLNAWYACLGVSPGAVIDSTIAAKMAACGTQVGLPMQGLNPISYIGQSVGSFVTAMLKSNGQYSTDPLTSIADSIGGIAGVIGKLVDPSTWVALLAFVAGAGMIVWGANRVLGATGGPSMPNVADRLPIRVR